MNIKRILLSAALSGLLLVGCKPTENNYKSAYDAALAKRQKDAADPDLVLPAGGMQKIGAPEKKTVDGREVYMLFQFLHPLEGSGEVNMKRFNVAVGEYRMPTNCKAQVADLTAAGYKAFGAQGEKERYFVVAATFDTLSEAASFVGEYAAAHKDVAYVGLPGAPVILETRL